MRPVVSLRVLLLAMAVLAGVAFVVAELRNRYAAIRPLHAERLSVCLSRTRFQWLADRVLAPELLREFQECERNTIVFPGSLDLDDAKLASYLPHLRQLDIRSVHIPPRSYISEKSGDTLNKLNLERLNVSGTYVNDEFVERIACIPTLTELDLSNTSVTENSVRFLVTMRGLRRLFVTRRFSSDAILRLRSELPNCEVF